MSGGRRIALYVGLLGTLFVVLVIGGTIFRDATDQLTVHVDYYLAALALLYWLAYFGSAVR